MSHLYMLSWSSSDFPPQTPPLNSCRHVTSSQAVMTFVRLSTNTKTTYSKVQWANIIHWPTHTYHSLMDTHRRTHQEHSLMDTHRRTYQEHSLMDTHRRTYQEHSNRLHHGCAVSNYWPWLYGGVGNVRLGSVELGNVITPLLIVVIISIIHVRLEDAGVCSHQINTVMLD